MKLPGPDMAETDSRSAGPLSRPILLLTLAFFVNFTTRSMIGPLLPLLEEELGLSHTQSGALFLFNSVGGFVSLISSSFILSRIGYHRTIFAAMVGVGAIVLLIGLSGSWLALILVFTLLGLASGLYIPSALVIIESIVPPAMLARAMAIHEMAPNLGLISAPLLVGFMLGGISWRGAFFIAGTACLLVGTVWFRFGQGGRFKAHPPSRAVIAQALARPEMWILGALFAIGLAAEIGIYNVLPLFLVTERGFSLTQANYLVGVSRIPTVAAAILVTGISLLLLGLGPDWLTPYCLFVQAMGSGAFWPPALAVLARAGSSETKAIVVSWATAMASVAGFGLVPAGIGALADLGSFAWGITATGVVVLGGLILVPRLDKK